MAKLNLTMFSTCKMAFGQYVDDGIKRLHEKLHIQNMEIKPHTSYCIVHRFYEFFRQRYDLEEIYKCKGRFGCDFVNYNDMNRLVPYAYERLLNMPCAYFNISYTEEVTNIERDEEYVQTAYSMYQLVAEEFLYFNNNNMCVINPYKHQLEYEFYIET